MSGRRTVLTAENKGQIILLKKQGLSVRKIADKVGISKSAVSNFLKTTPPETADVAPVAPVAPTPVEQAPNIPILNLPHSHQITDDDIEQLKIDLKYPDIELHSLVKGHQKKCHCYKCSMIRKKNLIALKIWQSQNVTRTKDNE